jgi:hypothetical protein
MITEHCFGMEADMQGQFGPAEGTNVCAHVHREAITVVSQYPIKTNEENRFAEYRW